MKKMILAFILGTTLGYGASYLYLKRKFKNELDEKVKSIADTNEALKEIKAKKEEVLEPETKPEENASNDDENGHVDVLKLSEEEIKNGEASVDDSYEDDDAWGDDYLTEDEREAERARLEYMKEIEEYIGGDIPYNITEDMYNEPYNGFNKTICMINLKDDKAYDANTGEEIEDYHTYIGDRDYGTCDDSRKDKNGRIFVRSELMSTDFEISYDMFKWLG